MMCGYCAQAKTLLRKKGVEFEEIDVSFDITLRKFMIERAKGRSTVPQIFIDGLGIGGCDELYDLEQTGDLDELIHRQKPESFACCLRTDECW